MGKVLWHTMMSLDGFIAGPNDDMRWVFGVDGGEGETMDEVVARRARCWSVAGRRTLRIGCSRGSMEVRFAGRSLSCGTTRRRSPPS